MAVCVSPCRGLHRTLQSTNAVRPASTPASFQRPCIRIDSGSRIFTSAHRPAGDAGPVSRDVACPCCRASPSSAAQAVETRCSRSSYHRHLNPLFPRPAIKYGPAIFSREAIAEQLATSVLRGGKFAARAVLEGVAPLLSTGVKTVIQNPPAEQAKPATPPQVQRSKFAPVAPRVSDAFDEDLHGNGQEDLFWDGEWLAETEPVDKDEDGDLYYGLRMATRASLAEAAKSAPKSAPAATPPAEANKSSLPRLPDINLMAFIKDPARTLGLFGCALATVIFQQPLLLFLPVLGAKLALVMRAYNIAEVAGAMAAVVGGGVASLVTPDSSLPFAPILVAVTYMVLRASAQSATWEDDEVASA
eukprot:jgi/Mesvir1/25991/Mv20959-RA.1